MTSLYRNPTTWHTQFFLISAQNESYVVNVSTLTGFQPVVFARNQRLKSLSQRSLGHRPKYAGEPFRQAEGLQEPRFVPAQV